MNDGIPSGNTIKIAISVPERLLQGADKAASELGISRSRLFAIAIDDFLRRRRNDEILHRLNEVYAEPAAASEKRLLRGIKAQFRRTVKERW